ncbi:MAG TPA: N-acetylmuramoyl-L-alanine amidase [Candidatus Paceibacterota bacterium]
MAHVDDRTALTDPDNHEGKMEPGDPDGIVLHHTGSRNEESDMNWLSRYHVRPASVNQLIRRDGTIVQIVPNDVISWHAGKSSLNGRDDCNSWCIGIEICNAGDGTESYTPAQYEAVAETIAYNCARFIIPDHNVSSHARVSAAVGRTDKHDPVGWDWKRMWARVDVLRANWPWGNSPKEWHEIVPRVMTTE